MNRFYIEKSIVIGHPDGWRYVVSIHDEPPVIKMEYQEYDKTWVTKETLDGLWSESARLVAKALCELANVIDTENEKVKNV